MQHSLFPDDWGLHENPVNLCPSCRQRGLRRLIQASGTLSRLMCVHCGYIVPGDELRTKPHPSSSADDDDFAD